jgi:hypothetical protein
MSESTLSFAHTNSYLELATFVESGKYPLTLPMGAHTNGKWVSYTPKIVKEISEDLAVVARIAARTPAHVASSLSEYIEHAWPALQREIVEQNIMRKRIGMHRLDRRLLGTDLVQQIQSMHTNYQEMLIRTGPARP